jgi:acetyl-CoA synthetase
MGDLVQHDEDGYLYLVGRGDDVITLAGHLIGPFELESAFMEHPAVAEVGVVGLPDPLLGEVVKAFVTLKPGHAPTEELRLELPGWGRRADLGAAVAPRSIAFSDRLPRSKSGNIMRRLLRARELGLAGGGTPRPWRGPLERPSGARGQARAAPVPRDAPLPPVRGALHRAVQR